MQARNANIRVRRNKNKFMGFDCFGETSCTWACAFNVVGQILKANETSESSRCQYKFCKSTHSPGTGL